MGMVALLNKLRVLCPSALIIGGAVLSCDAGASWVSGILPVNITYDGRYLMATFAPSGTVAVPGCSANDFYAINASDDTKTLLSMLLTAKAMGRTVAIFVPDDSTRCNGQSGRPAVTNVRIEG